MHHAVFEPILQCVCNPSSLNMCTHNEWHRMVHNTQLLQQLHTSFTKQNWALPVGHFSLDICSFPASDARIATVSVSFFRLLICRSVLSHRWYNFNSFVCFWCRRRRCSAVWQMSVRLWTAMTSRTRCGHRLTQFLCTAKHCYLLTHQCSIICHLIHRIRSFSAAESHDNIQLMHDGECDMLQYMTRSWNVNKRA